ncbi:MAG: SufE family protein [Rikenellaceae bacterium]
MTINEIQDEIIEEFSVFDDWMDKYSYLIEMADTLPVIDEKLKDPAHLIDGCQSRVWIDAQLRGGVMQITGDSDAILVKGLVALLLRVFNGQRPQDVAAADLYFIDRIGMRENLSPTRANGLLSMIKQIKYYAVAMSS